MDILQRCGALEVIGAVIEKSTEVDLQQTGLMALDSVLEFSWAHKLGHRRRLSELGIEDKLEVLLNHPNKDVWKTASNILGTYFGWTCNDDEDASSDEPETDVNENAEGDSVKLSASGPQPPKRHHASETPTATKPAASDNSTSTRSDREHLGDRVLNDKE